MPITQEPIGRGQFIWLGINEGRGGFSTPCTVLTIADDGIVGDMYRKMWREISGHDVDYIATDGVAKGDKVLNLRQITIVDAAEVDLASAEAGVAIDRGMLRENMTVSFVPQDGNRLFSKLPPLSRMVIGRDNPKVLILSEENGPCGTIALPIARQHQGGAELVHRLRTALKGRRGQMAMVRSAERKEVRLGDTFTVFPPMT